MNHTHDEHEDQGCTSLPAAVPRRLNLFSKLLYLLRLSKTLSCTVSKLFLTKFAILALYRSYLKVEISFGSSTVCLYSYIMCASKENDPIL